MKINIYNVRFYLDKFFEGETTRLEEKELSKFFHESNDLPTDLEFYKEMFACIDQETRAKKYPFPSKFFSSGLRKYAYWGCVAAVLAIVILTVILKVRNSSNSSFPEQIYAGSYVYHAKVRNDNIREIMPEIRSTLQAVEDMKKEIKNIHVEKQDLLYDFSINVETTKF
ncbi:MAG: hypothetical protein J1E78_04160 [Muribaculaceae bacterium]|nr:hypothetical protein [Muribaculaceae bacterium]